MDERKRAAILRRMAQAGGLNVVCVRCLGRWKHVPGTRPRLRDRACPKCGGKLRAQAWVTRHPDRFATEVRQGRRPGELY